MTQTAALLIWGILLVLFVVIEATSVQLVSVWFAVGAFAALIAAAVGVTEFWLQAIIAVAVSAGVLFAMRPIAKKFREKAKEKLNADRAIGRHGVVTAEINNLAGTGMSRVAGALWTARASDESVVIPEGARVTVEKIEGVKAIVRLSRSESKTNEQK